MILYPYPCETPPDRSILRTSYHSFIHYTYRHIPAPPNPLINPLVSSSKSNQFQSSSIHPTPRATLFHSILFLYPHHQPVRHIPHQDNPFLPSFPLFLPSIPSPPSTPAPNLDLLHHTTPPPNSLDPLAMQSSPLHLAQQKKKKKKKKPEKKSLVASTQSSTHARSHAMHRVELVGRIEIFY